MISSSTQTLILDLPSPVNTVKIPEFAGTPNLVDRGGRYWVASIGSWRYSQNLTHFNGETAAHNHTIQYGETGNEDL